MIFAVEAFVANLLSEKNSIKIFILRFFLAFLAFLLLYQSNDHRLMQISISFSKFQKAFFVLALAITGVLADVSHLGITTQIEEDGYH